MSDEQMAITFPPGSVDTGTAPGFHQRCEGYIFNHGGNTPYGNPTDPAWTLGTM